MKTNFFRKVMVFYAAIFFIIITATFWLSYKGSTSRLETEVRYTNMELLKQIDQKIEMMLREIDKDVLHLMEELEFVYFMHNSYSGNAHKYSNFYALTSKMKILMNSNPHLSSLYLYSGVSGDILTDTAFSSKEDFTDRLWIDDSGKMKEYSKWLSTRSIPDPDKKKNVVTLVRAYPLVSSPEFRKGSVAVNIDETILYNMIKDIYVERLGHTFIIDAEANVISHDDKNWLFRNIKDEPYMASVSASAGSGSVTRTINGEEQTVFYVNSKYTGWKIISIVPQTKINKPITVVRNFLLVLALIMFIAALALVFIVNKLTFRPLDRLIGRVSVRVRTKQGTAQRKGGLYYLEHVFDQMMSDQSDMQQQIRDSKPLMKWRMVMDMLIGYRSDYAKVQHHLDFMGIRLDPRNYIVCSAELEKTGKPGNPKDIHLLTYALCNVAEELINVENKGVAVELNHGRAAFIISFADNNPEQNQLRALAVADLIRDVMRNQFHRSITIGVGKHYTEMKDIGCSYEESLKALQFRMVMGNNVVISIEDLHILEDKEYYRVFQMTDLIVDALRQADVDKTRLRLEQLFHEAVRSNFSPEIIKQLSFGLAMKSFKCVYGMGLDEQQMSDRIGNFHDSLSKCEDWKDILEYVTAVFTQIVHTIAEKRSIRGKNETVEKVIAFINRNYQKSDLSLNQLADMYGLSTPHLSRIFKEHTESNFMDYLIHVRINASKELLAQRSLKVNDIAEAVGYSNNHSFLRMFKKYTGLTPTEYRDQLALNRKAAD